MLHLTVFSEWGYVVHNKYLERTCVTYFCIINAEKDVIGQEKCLLVLMFFLPEDI